MDVFKKNVVLLGLLTGTSPRFWMTLQTRHDLWLAVREVGKRTVKAIRIKSKLDAWLCAAAARTPEDPGLRRSQTH